MQFTLIRHASHILEYNGKKLLVDPPVFADKGAMFSMPKGRVKEKNPLLPPLPFKLDFIDSIDAVLITHTHFDHFDDKAKEMLPKHLPIICRSNDVKDISRAGFTNIVPIDDTQILFDKIQIRTVGGKHGSGLVGYLMGKTTGFILSDVSDYSTEPTTYITGDSIWCDEVAKTLIENNPELIIAFVGAARLPPIGNHITMSTSDIHNLATKSNDARIIAIHMNAWNHCFLTKEDLKCFIKDKDYHNRIHIPDEGDLVHV